jgi:hypothetical protein
MPELHAPIPCVVPSENMVSSSSRLYITVMGLDATAFDSTLFFMREIFLVIKLAAVAIEQQKLKRKSRILTKMVNRRLTKGRLK